jgi:2,4-dienoyl-CoA reductase (NADPH2)
VAVIGAGGIGFDVAEYLLHEGTAVVDEVAAFQHEWGVDPAAESVGGLRAEAPVQPQREVTVLQRKPDKPGRTLGLSTGWALKARLARQQVKWLTGCQYQRIDDDGLHITVNGQPQRLAVDSIVLCAGQERERRLFDSLQAAGITADVIGGADRAEELDALRAIEQGTRLAWKM